MAPGPKSPTVDKAKATIGIEPSEPAASVAGQMYQPVFAYVKPGEFPFAPVPKTSVWDGAGIGGDQSHGVVRPDQQVDSLAEDALALVEQLELGNREAATNKLGSIYTSSGNNGPQRMAALNGHVARILFERYPDLTWQDFENAVPAVGAAPSTRSNTALWFAFCGLGLKPGKADDVTLKRFETAMRGFDVKPLTPLQNVMNGIASAAATLVDGIYQATDFQIGDSPTTLGQMIGGPVAGVTKGTLGLIATPTSEDVGHSAVSGRYVRKPIGLGQIVPEMAGEMVFPTKAATMGAAAWRRLLPAYTAEHLQPTYATTAAASGRASVNRADDVATRLRQPMRHEGGVDGPEFGSVKPGGEKPLQVAANSEREAAHLQRVVDGLRLEEIQTGDVVIMKGRREGPTFKVGQLGSVDDAGVQVGGHRYLPSEVGFFTKIQPGDKLAVSIPDEYGVLHGSARIESIIVEDGGQVRLIFDDHELDVRAMSYVSKL